MIAVHEPVLLNAVMELSAPAPGRRVMDVTVGCGGHAVRLLERILPGGFLFGIDRDGEVLAQAAEALGYGGAAVSLAHGDFKQVLAEDRIEFQSGFHCILADLGCSAVQLDNASRGFSFQLDGPLDMRMDRSSGLTAAEMLARVSERELGRWLREYGEERWWKRIASAIVRRRTVNPIKTTGELSRLICEVVPGRRRRIHPATRSFMAIRIAVNGELEGLDAALDRMIDLLSPGGRLVVISFHSLEDRIVKRRFQLETRDCVCPPEILQCRCNHKRKGFLPVKRPIIPDAGEVAGNPRSRSAKMRVFERLP